MTPGTENKITTLERAVRQYVADGCHLSIGGFTISRNPMAAVHEIIRQKIRNIHAYAHSNGQGIDELIGAGCISRLEIAYSGNGRFAPTCKCFKRSVLDRSLAVEDYTNFQMALRFLAGAMGVPFLPTYSSLETDIINKWGFSHQLRSNDPRLANKKLAVMDNPFADRDANEKLVLVPAIHPDVTIIHAQTASPSGYVRIDGLTFADIDQAKAARHVIVTCEQLIDDPEMKQNPAANQLPGFCVDAVVHVPFGAYPTACFNAYDYDPVFLEAYSEAAETETGIQAFIRKYITAPGSHDAFLSLAAGNRLSDIAADPETGYADRMKRR